MDLEGFMLSEMSDKKKKKYIPHDSSHMQNLKIKETKQNKNRPTDKENKLLVIRRVRGGAWVGIKSRAGIN